MGSQETGATAAEDGCVGPIVWVRRRNGSWWPGKILEPDELADCNVSSPRTGTPVKLLGREDASIDWYNLEKSKRVKAFRCGEFDDCIERAESALGMPIKKREKYARREDAILHALELEKELLKKQGKSVPRSKSSGSAKKEYGSVSEGLGGNSGKLENDGLNQIVNGINTSVKYKTISRPMHPLNAKDGHQPKWEDDDTEATPRIRGLQDLGLWTVPLKRKLSSSTDSDGSRKHIVNNHSQDPSSVVHSMQQMDQANGMDQVGTIFQAKRSRRVYLPLECNDPLDDKEITPSQSKVLPSHFEDDKYYPSGSLNGDNFSSETMEDGELDSSESVSADSESNSSATEPDADKEMVVFSDAAVPTEAEQDAPGRTEAQELGSSSTEEHDESVLSSDMSHLHTDDPFYGSEAVSKWRFKGKRNIRHLTKNYTAAVRIGKPHHRSYHRVKGSFRGLRACIGDSDFDKRYIGTQIGRLDNGRHFYPSRFGMKDRNHTSLDVVDWEDMNWDDQPTFRRGWEDIGEPFNPLFASPHNIGRRLRSMLVDVDLKVQASYKKESVPIVSLTSKFNGNAIIGHPIQIKVLEDGSSNSLIPTSEGYYNNEVVDRDGSMALSPTWRTARRTNFRVPRPHLSSVLAVHETARDLSFVDKERRPPQKKSTLGSFGHKESLVMRSLPCTSRPSLHRKHPKKSPKKVSSSSNQKTRTLSSITIQQNSGIKHIHGGSSVEMDGRIKPHTSGLTTVSCIPMKLVFSRLLEKINRPPLKAAGKAFGSGRNTDGQSS
uniref:PWWP domain-containing protein n=1 Tax=Rhizophora mucronata TaxID=61149 RepID=A0A2P2KCB6_RHIMU